MKLGKIPRNPLCDKPWYCPVAEFHKQSEMVLVKIPMPALVNGNWYALLLLSLSRLYSLRQLVNLFPRSCDPVWGYIPIWFSFGLSSCIKTQSPTVSILLVLVLREGAGVNQPLHQPICLLAIRHHLLGVIHLQELDR